MQHEGLPIVILDDRPPQRVATEKPEAPYSGYWQTLASMLEARQGVPLSLDTLESYIRITLSGQVPQEEVGALGRLMLEDILWEHRQRYSSDDMTTGTVAAICRDCHEVAGQSS